MAKSGSVIIGVERSAVERLALTPRERQILGHVAASWPNAAIAARLGIAPQTVKNHLTNVYDKLGVRRRRHAAGDELFHSAAPT